MPENYQFVHQFPEHPEPRAFSVDGEPCIASQISVRRVINKSRARRLMIAASELPRATILWQGDEYDAQATGGGFGQAEIEARVEELFAPAE